MDHHNLSSLALSCSQEIIFLPGLVGLGWVGLDWEEGFNALGDGCGCRCGCGYGFPARNWMEYKSRYVTQEFFKFRSKSWTFVDLDGCK